MKISRNKLYILLFIACIAGYIWLYLVFNSAENTSFSVCLFKNITTIPCPSCGSTRAVLSVLKGDIIESINMNPMGLVIFAIMVLSPIIIVYDVLFSKNTLYDLYYRVEYYIKRKNTSVFLIILVFSNWIWNIIKQI
ncbi:MAG: DUF2752 domain-containing protein [Flavobacteriaceae bacterium]|nr:DUF2752 domain-containing protein [Flavobacteriaceae bacterium]